MSRGEMRELEKFAKIPIERRPTKTKRESRATNSISLDDRLARAGLRSGSAGVSRDKGAYSYRRTHGYSERLYMPVGSLALAPLRDCLHQRQRV